MAINPRSKGRAGEYLARDTMRRMGWTADRVPFSGAMQGYKGDIKLSKGDLVLTAEVKNWKAGKFKHIYGLLSKYGCPFKVNYNGQYAIVSYAFMDLGFEDKAELLFDVTLNDKAVTNLFKLRSFLKTADFLMIREDRKPFIFIRYFGE